MADLTPNKSLKEYLNNAGLTYSQESMFVYLIKDNNGCIVYTGIPDAVWDWAKNNGIAYDDGNRYIYPFKPFKE